MKKFTIILITLTIAVGLFLFVRFCLEPEVRFETGKSWK